MRKTIQCLGVAVMIPYLCACGPESGSVTKSLQTTPASSSIATGLPTVFVSKSASCGCCGAWVEHMRRAGFNVEIHNVDNLEPIKQGSGIPANMQSCHTAHVGRYFVEGHVPATDVKRLLAEHSDAKGLVVPNMPAGSPGMETEPGKVESYNVYVVANDGTTSVYAHYGD